MINEYEVNRNHEQTCCKSNEIVTKRKESIVTCFEITLGLTNSTADEELFAMWNPHLREDFLTHFANVAEEFRNFALFQRFCSFLEFTGVKGFSRVLICLVNFKFLTLHKLWPKIT